MSGLALQVVQEIKVMRSSVTAREKERAERATLVQQEKLSKAKVLPAVSAGGLLQSCIVDAAAFLCRRRLTTFL